MLKCLKGLIVNYEPAVPQIGRCKHDDPSQRSDTCQTVQIPVTA